MFKRFSTLFVTVSIIAAFLIGMVWNQKDIEAQAKMQNATQVPVLMYHGIKSDAEYEKSPYNSAIIRLSDFEKQMKYLADNGFHTITVQEMNDFLDGKIQLPRKSVMIQFDDGLRSMHRYAYPVMKKYNLHGVANLITSRNSDGPADKWDYTRNQYVNQAMLDEMTDVFEYEGHTHNLHSLVNKVSRLTLLSPEQIKNDLLITKDKLAKYGEVTLFAYPYGQYNDKVIEALKAAGYKTAYTIKKGYVKSWDNPYELNRNGINPKTSFEDFKALVNNTVAPIFTDIPLNHSNFEQTFWLYSNHIIKGYPDNKFRPKQAITRAQSAKMLVQALGLEVPNSVTEAPFTDLPLDYNDEYLVRAAAALKEAGVFHGDDGKFRPREVLTREQMASVLVNTFQWENSGQNVNVKDLQSASATHRESITILAQQGITVLPEGKFNPKNPTWRIHLASFLYQAMNK